MATAKKSGGVKAPLTIKKPEGSPECYGKYIFAGSGKCRACKFHVECKKVKK